MVGAGPLRVRDREHQIQPVIARPGLALERHYLADQKECLPELVIDVTAGVIERYVGRKLVLMIAHGKPERPVDVCLHHDRHGKFPDLIAEPFIVSGKVAQNLDLRAV